jgi:uncharacterized membrane protein YdbT with pleckstrin-like domain
MALSKMLMDGESAVLSTRTHVKALIVPFLLLVALSFATAYLAGLAGDEAGGWVRRAVLTLALVLFVVGTLVPFLRWLTWTYHLTDLRLIEQKGILTRTGRVIPLNRINDVSYEKSLTDRILGCGTLVIRNAAEEAGLELRDIPHVEAVARELSSRVRRADAVD